MKRENCKMKAIRGSANSYYLTVTNEKYSFRVWLTSIGMNGKEYGAARAELLMNFKGDGAFRTPEQRAAFYERRKRRSEAEFVLL